MRENTLPTAHLPALRLTEQAIAKVKAFALAKPEQAAGKYFPRMPPAPAVVVYLSL